MLVGIQCDSVMGAACLFPVILFLLTCNRCSLIWRRSVITIIITIIIIIIIIIIVIIIIIIIIIIIS